MQELTRKQRRIADRRLKANPTLIKDLFEQHDKREAKRKEDDLNNWKVSKQRKIAIGLIIFTFIVINLFIWL